MSDPIITLHQGDLPADVSFGDAVAIDTETLGLSLTRDRLCLIQLSAGDGTAHLVKFKAGEYNAPNLQRLMADPKVLKLFHYGRFDLAMIKRYLGVMPSPVYCTKIASALTRTFTDRHGLKDVVRDAVGVELAKEQQSSDWGADELKPEQLKYAANDVLYLHRVRDKFDVMLAREGRTELAKKIFDFLPTRVELDLAGWENVDIFSHKPVPKNKD